MQDHADRLTPTRPIQFYEKFGLSARVAYTMFDDGVIKRYDSKLR